MTYRIDDGNGNELTVGLSDREEALRVAQRMADDREETVYVSRDVEGSPTTTVHPRTLERCAAAGKRTIKHPSTRFEGSGGIYKVFIRQRNAYVYERTITVSGKPTSAKKHSALTAARDLEQFRRDTGAAD